MEFEYFAFFVFGVVGGFTVVLGLLLFTITYPEIAETNADFFCGSRDLDVKDFEQKGGKLVFVECEERNSVSEYYFESGVKS